VALYLRCAYETGYKTLDYLHEEGRGMYWSNLHAIEMAEGLVEAMLDGIEVSACGAEVGVRLTGACLGFCIVA
jgi:hypothetical protein